MPVLALHMTQTRYGTADAIVALTVGGVARPDVTIKATDKRTPHVEQITGAWLPGSTVAVTLALRNDLYEPPKGDRNAHLLAVHLDGVDQKIVRDVFGAAEVRFDVTVPAAKPATAPGPAPGAASGLSAADRALLEAVLAKVTAIEAAQNKFYSDIEIVAEGAPAAAE